MFLCIVSGSEWILLELETAELTSSMSSSPSFVNGFGRMSFIPEMYMVSSISGVQRRRTYQRSSMS